MYDTLLFLHVLSAFCLAGGIVIYSAFVLGGPVHGPTRTLAEILWGIGGLGVLIFGIWLAINVDGYEVTDGWILAAILLWFVVTETGRRTTMGVQVPGDDSAVAIDSRTALMHWTRTALTLAMLVLIVWKPGA